MLKIIVCSILISLSLFGAKVEKKAVSTSLVKEKMQPIKKTTIEGQGFLKTRGGDVKTCAGELVFLYKKDDYKKLAKERIIENFRDHGKQYENGTNTNYYYSKIVNDIAKLQELYPQLNIRSIYQKDTFNEDIDKVKNYELGQIAKLGTISKPVLESQCDATGNFNFKNIPFGDYGIVTTVTWTNGESIQGGEVGKEITVSDTLQKVFVTDRFPN